MSVLPVISSRASGIRGVDPAWRPVPRLVPICGKITLKCNRCMTMYVSKWICVHVYPYYFYVCMYVS